jgi:hypothetical protein
MKFEKLDFVAELYTTLASYYEKLGQINDHIEVLNNVKNN